MPAELDEAVSARELDERGIPAELDEAVSARELDERAMAGELDEPNPTQAKRSVGIENHAHISVSPPEGVMSTTENKHNPANKRRYLAFVQYAENHKGDRGRYRETEDNSAATE